MPSEPARLRIDKEGASAGIFPEGDNTFRQRVHACGYLYVYNIMSLPSKLSRMSVDLIIDEDNSGVSELLCPPLLVSGPSDKFLVPSIAC